MLVLPFNFNGFPCVAGFHPVRFSAFPGFCVLVPFVSFKAIKKQSARQPPQESASASPAHWNDTRPAKVAIIPTSARHGTFKRPARLSGRVTESTLARPTVAELNPAQGTGEGGGHPPCSGQNKTVSSKPSRRPEKPVSSRR
jgi:hypothetical protein